MSRRYIHRGSAPPIIWAVRLELADDGSFALHERTYYSDDGTEGSAAGRWVQRGDIVCLTAAQSEVSLAPAGVEVRFEIVGEDLMIAGQLFEPDRD